MAKLVMVYVYDSCCWEAADNAMGAQQRGPLSHEQLIKNGEMAVTLWVAPDDYEGPLWGDDWDDAPSCCNAGTPYSDAPVRAITLRYGQSIALPIEAKP